MADTAPRVVVLGRPGEAQQQLQHALDELGAHTLAVGDFDQLDPAKMREQQPDVWLVSMDENTDAARLERWQPLFDDPDATVVFDDADVTSRLSGWDLARWARHLAAKVSGRNDVLPPVSPDAERLPIRAPAVETDEPDGAAVAGVSDLLISDADANFAALNASFESERKQLDTGARAHPVAQSLDDLLRADSGSASPGSDVATPAAGNASPVASSLDGLSLLDMDADLSATKVERKEAAPVVAFDLSHFELEPIEDAQPVAATDSDHGGLIAIIAGLGGPDAVRQFLSALPASLPVPVLLWQHLDAGKHDRLAQQLSKATKLPVYLAKAGEVAKNGAVGVMGAGMAILSDAGWWFESGSPSPTHSLAAAMNDSATTIVVLSGAEAAIIEPARAHLSSKGQVLAQTPATCFDATAASALEKQQGVTVGSPAELAKLAAERWAAAK